MSSFKCDLCADSFDSPSHITACPPGVYLYTAKNGVKVRSVAEPADDFKTVFHYMRFSYGSWVTKIRKAVKLDWTYKLQSVGILKPS